MTRRVRNLGFSLVELIVAFAVLGIATLGIGSLFVVSTRSSSMTQEQSGIYNETQLASNQIENMIQKAELGLSYRCDGAFVLQDNEAAAEKVLYIFNVSNTGKLELLLLKWDKSTNEVQYAEMTNISDENVSEIAMPAAADWALLAEDVKTFAVKLDGNNSKVYLNMIFEDRTSYEIKQTIAIRNQVVYNPQTLAEVNDKITVNVVSEITEVKINVSPKILAPRASINLTKNVYGIGTLPSYQTKWLISKDPNMGTLIDKFDYTTVSEDIVGLKISEEETSGYTGSFYVQAVVTWKESKVIDNVVTEIERTVKSNIEQFKIIQDMVVKIEGDDRGSSLTNPRSDAYQVANGKKYQMSAIIGEEDEEVSLSVYEQRVVWSIEGKSVGVDATIAQDGVLSIGNYSYGGTFNVVATLAKNDSIKVSFPCNVGQTYSQDDDLILSPTKGDGLINRGGEVGFTVRLSDHDVNPEDCNWTVGISYKDIDGREHAVSSSSLTIGNSGVVTVNRNLFHERSYEIMVRATLKNDSNISGNYKLVVPEVSVKIEQLTATELKRGGEPIDLKCTVTGLEDYQLEWTMSRSMNPTYFFGALGNTSVTDVTSEYKKLTEGGDPESEEEDIWDLIENSKSKKDGIEYGRVILGSDEPAEVTQVIVKAQLIGSSVKAVAQPLNVKAAEWDITLKQDGKIIPIDGTGVIAKRPRFTIWDWKNVSVDCRIENGDSSKISWQVTGKGATKENSSFYVKYNGGGEITVTVTYDGIPEYTKSFTVTAN